MQHTLELPAVALKNAFAGLSKVISSKSTLPVLGCVRVEADANGDARFQVTDLDSFATGHVQAPVLAASRPASSRSTRSTASSRAPRTRSASCRRTARSASSPASAPPRWRNRWAPSAERMAACAGTARPTFTGDAAFKKALREALECASTDSSRYVINGACLDLSHPTAIASSARMAVICSRPTRSSFDLPKSVIIPTRKFLAWSGFSQDGDWRVALSLDKKGEPEWVQLESDHWSVHHQADQRQLPELAAGHSLHGPQDRHGHVERGGRRPDARCSAAVAGQRRHLPTGDARHCRWAVLA